jgi:hypothetical protein
MNAMQQPQAQPAPRAVSSAAEAELLMKRARGFYAIRDDHGLPPRAWWDYLEYHLRNQGKGGERR